MPLHLIKLAVGCESVKELRGWVAERMKTAKKKGLPQRHVHITRMTPKRIEEILAGGSLYWVIRGEIAAREKIVAVEPFRDRDGIGRCRLVMQPKVIAVSPRSMRPSARPGSVASRSGAPASRAGAISPKMRLPPISPRRLREVSLPCPSRCAASCATLGCSDTAKPRCCRSAAWFQAWPRPESASARPSLMQLAPACRRRGPRNSPAQNPLP